MEVERHRRGAAAGEGQRRSAGAARIAARATGAVVDGTRGSCGSGGLAGRSCRSAGGDRRQRHRQAEASRLRPWRGSIRSRVARLPRPRARRRRARRPTRYGLERPPAAGAVAPADRTGVVVLRRARRPHLYAGAARRRRGRVRLQPEDGRAGVAASRWRAVLGVECRCGTARDPDARQRPRLHAWRHRPSQRARRTDRARDLVAQRDDRHESRRFPTGASPVHPSSSATSSSSPLPACWPPTTPPAARRSG